jgi:DNA transposition AAA+ family ATPase
MRIPFPFEIDQHGAHRYARLEKRAARYPQFFSRIGFVHEFRALAAAEVQTLLEENWTALASGSLAEAPAPDVVAAIIRVTGGNFRLITRLLTQMERVFNINQLKHLSPAVVEAARENLVIGQVWMFRILYRRFSKVKMTRAYAK